MKQIHQFCFIVLYIFYTVKFFFFIFVWLTLLTTHLQISPFSCPVLFYIYLILSLYFAELSVQYSWKTIYMFCPALHLCIRLCYHSVHEQSLVYMSAKNYLHRCLYVLCICIWYYIISRPARKFLTHMVV